MNSAVFGLFLICCQVWAIETNDDAKNIYMSMQMGDSMKRMKSVLKLGIPQLDPYTRESLIIDTSDVITVIGYFTDITVNDLSEYEINNAEFNPSRVILDLTVPLITTAANYTNFNGTVDKIAFYGDKGDVNLSIKNLRFIARANYTLSNDWKRMYVTEIETELSLDEFNFRASNLFSDDVTSNIINYMISEAMPGIIIKKQFIITEELNKILMEIADHITYTLTFKEILEMLGINPFDYIAAI